MAFYEYFVYLLAFVGIFAATFYVINVLTYYNKEQPKSKVLRTVSIVIPAYNEEASIKSTIESALALDYPRNKLEIIVVDDGSRDKTYQIAKKFENEGRVKVFTKENGGKGSALNLGIGKARGEIVVTMDADTFVRENALKEMVSMFYSDNVMAVTPSMGIYSPKTFWQKVQHVEYYMGVFLRKAFATMNAVHITPGAFSAYRREFFLKYGGYDEHNITEDLEIALRIQSNNYIIENNPKAVVYTIAPPGFRELLVQRRRWYTGLIKNLWNYSHLFGKKYGALGMVVLPVALVTMLLSVVLTVYTFSRTLIDVKNELVSLIAINFRFDNTFEFNKYILERLFYSLFSNKLFLLAIIFIVFVGLYVLFSKKQIKYKEGILFNFILFILFYSIIFAFWWIVSLFYLLFNKKVIWRGKKDAKL